MDRKIFNKLRELIYEKSGIRLRDSKEALVHARVAKRMRALGMDDYKTYFNYVIEDETGGETVQLLDVISTNVTSFFREADHFEFLENAMDNWVSSGQKRFRVWSAACSTGEEPYSIAITMLEATGNRNLDMKILATDISTRVLDKARQGVYAREKIELIPRVLRDRYFGKYSHTNGVYYKVKRLLTDMIVFRRMNLSAPPFPMRGPLDAIFCRNVMIYFDNPIRTALLAEMFRLLKPGGYLFVGHAESLTGMVSSFKSLRPSIYVKN